MATEEMNAGEIPAEETAAEDEAAMEAAKAAEKAEKEAAKAAAKAEKEAAKAAAKVEAEAARAARAEERAAKREERKATKQAAAEERSEQKAAKQAEREAAAAQKKADQEAAAREKSEKAADQEAAAAEEAESPAVSSPASVAPAADADSATSDAEERPSVLPAKLSKEKRPKKAKKVKPSSAKGIRRAIRPIRSRTQQTTARLIWAVFGMALVIVAIVGFWLVISNQEDSTEVEVLVAAANLTEGEFIGYDDISFATIDIQDGTLAYLPSSNRDSLVGRVILRDVAQDTNLSLDMFGSSNIEEEVLQESEIVFELEFPSEVTLDEEGVSAGDRVVILVGNAESPSRLAFEVVDVETSTENSISLEGSLDYRYWWQQQLAQYENQEGIVFEITRVPDPSVPQLCWRERYRQIYQIQPLPRSDYEQLIEELSCPEYFLESGAGAPIPTTEPITDGTTEPGADGTTPSESVAERLERDRYIADRRVPDEINNPVATDGGDGGLGGLEDLGIDFSGIGFPEE